jgi:hypothetical protein
MLSVTGRFRNLRKKMNLTVRLPKCHPLNKTGGTCFLYYYFSVYVNLFKELMLRHKKNRSFEAKADAKVQQIPEPTKLLGTFFRKN